MQSHTHKIKIIFYILIESLNIWSKDLNFSNTKKSYKNG